jgi:hypothetical protein
MTTLWDHLSGQKLHEAMPFTSDMQRDEKIGRPPFNKKWLQINEEIAYKKLISNIRIMYR